MHFYAKLKKDEESVEYCSKKDTVVCVVPKKKYWVVWGSMLAVKSVFSIGVECLGIENGWEMVC